MMKEYLVQIIEFTNLKIAELMADGILINETQDALDIMAECNYQDAGNILLYKHNLNPDFFDLKTGIAGEILQKFSNYRVRLAIIGDYSTYNNKSLRDFIYESNKAGRIIFASSKEEAISRLTSLKK
jgi:hypothetical protein